MMNIWGVLKLEVPKNGWLINVYTGKSETKMDD
jgi:hypothetical protein